MIIEDLDRDGQPPWVQRFEPGQGHGLVRSIRKARRLPVSLLSSYFWRKLCRPVALVQNGMAMRFSAP